ncbi:MAG: acyl-CoA dehydrogenase [Sphingomonadaceae bacterium]|nr:acyl-CoA dehydrogenase [Sphingomonadaceae bacterium]
MAFQIPTQEQAFVLTHVAAIDELAGHERFAAASPDMVEAIIDGIAQVAEGEYAPLNRHGDLHNPRWVDGRVVMPDGVRAAYRATVDGGWGSIDAPEAYGGQGLPLSLASVVIESLGTANMGLTLINLLTPGAIHALIAYGSDAQKATYLPKLVSGEWNGTMNLTEPGAGSDVGALKTMAEPVGDGQWRIRGQKIFITFGEHDLTDNIVHLVLARTPDAPAGTRGISLFLVPKYRLDGAGAPTIDNGVRCLSIEHKLGIHNSPTCVMSYGEDGDCLGELIGDIHGGMRAMFVMMNNARLNVGNQGVQIAERATQQATSYAAERVQSARASAPGAGSVAIIDHPDVRRMLWRMRALTQGARAILYYAAGQMDRATLGDDAARMRADVLIPLVKAWATDMGVEVASIGIQVHGGMGFIEETGAAQHYRDARIAPIYEGTNGIQAADLVTRKLGLGDGAAMRAMIGDIAAAAPAGSPLAALATACGEVAGWMADASVDDRLAGSADFLHMLAVAVAGWQMLRQRDIATEILATGEGDADFLRAKCAAADFFLTQIVSEALGRRAGAMAGAAGLYAAF